MKKTFTVLVIVVVLASLGFLAYRLTASQTPEAKADERYSQLIEKYGGDVNGKDDYGATPLYEAVLNDDISPIRIP